jgi:hypothetical protein
LILLILAETESVQHFTSDYYGTTTVHPLALAALVVAAVCMLALPRKWALLPLIVLACFVPQSQRIVVLTLDFTFIRLMVMAGMLRVLIYQEYEGFQLKLFDKLMLWWAGCEIILGTLTGSASIVYFAGEVLQRLGLYFICRMLIRNFADVWRLTAAFAVIAVPVAVAFVYEHFTARNIFAIFGGVPAITDLRQGRLRCQGAFSHPILAGCFWAAWLPLMAVLWMDRSRRFFAMIGVVASLVIIVMCASSTPVFAVAMSGLGMCLISVRRHMRKLCWAAVGMLCALHMVMKAPVWHLIARVSAVSGSTGWHRYSLIDKFINRWQEWILRGSGRGTAHWGTGLFDVTNYYVIEGLRGGLFLLVLFIVVLNVGFRSVGRLVRSVEHERNKVLLFTAWALGVCLSQHCANFIAVTYFGQINVVWCMQLAMIGSLVPLKEPARRRARRAIRSESGTPAEPFEAPLPGPRPAPQRIPQPVGSDAPVYSALPVTTWVETR